MPDVEQRTRPEHDESLGEECECFRCHCLSITTSPYATPSRLQGKFAPKQPEPRWERGTPTDSRGVPMLDEKGNVMGAKAVSERRSEVDARRRQLHQQRTPLDRKE